MSRKVQTIYEYFKEYSEEMIDKVISDLNPEDKKLLVIRYGEDLHNPCPKEERKDIVQESIKEDPKK